MGSHPFGPLGGLQEKLTSSGPENQNPPLRRTSRTFLLLIYAARCSPRTNASSAHE